MKVYIESKDQIIEAETDSRGRLTLGSDYADSKVQVAVLEVEPEETDE